MHIGAPWGIYWPLGAAWCPLRGLPRAVLGGSWCNIGASRASFAPLGSILEWIDQNQGGDGDDDDDDDDDDDQPPRSNPNFGNCGSAATRTSARRGR